MGLPPAQGHSNLRLNTTTNYYPKYRLETTQYNKTRRTKQLFHTHLSHPSISFRSPHPQNPTMERRPSNQSNRFAAQILSSDRNSQCFSHDSQISSSSIPSIRLRNFQRNRSYQPVIVSQELKRYISSSDELRNRYRPKSLANISNFIPSNVSAVNSSIIQLNHSPFGLRDPRVGIFHHCSQSISYFWYIPNNCHETKYIQPQQLYIAWKYCI